MLEFERVECNRGMDVLRAKVPGGWLVVVEVFATTYRSSGPGYFESDPVGSYRCDPAFVPDPEWTWTP